MKHIVRSLKYLFTLILLLVVITLFMNFSGSLELSYKEQLALFMADGGALKISFFVLLAALYPLFGYIKRGVEGSVEQNRGQIDVAMQSSGFVFRRTDDRGRLIYGANTFFRRLTFLFEDEIVVEQVGEKIQIEGARRGVVYIVYCLDGFIKNSKRGE